MKNKHLKESIRNCANQQEEFRLLLAEAHERFIAISDGNSIIRFFCLNRASNKVAYWEYNLQRNKNRMKFLVNALNSNR